ncbi:MAG: aminotransferase class III-fold pyridoxal phosphate-dependent enzyme [Acidimicrobiales bacterium]
MSDPLLEPQPHVDATAAATLLADCYQLEGTLSPLHGERDRNFRVDTPSGRFVLKIHNPADGAAVVDMRTRAIAHVRAVDPSFPVPAVVPTATGEDMATVTAPDGRVSRVQLLTFLEGRHIGVDELDEDLLYDWGRSTARLGRALRGFFHRAAGYPIQWDIHRASELRDRLPLVDGDARDLVSTVLDRFDALVVPRFDGLRAQVVHGDLGPGNVLFGDDRRVSGITDFGDTTHTALVCDLAVVLAEVLQTSLGALELAEPIVAGYTSLTPLEDEEAYLLADMTAARAATEVVVTMWRRANHPHVTDEPDGAIALLRNLAETGFDKATSRLARMCRRATSPASLPYTSRPTGELAACRARVLGPLELSYEQPLHLVRSSGTAVFDAEGRRYLDAYNNVPVAGHCHPRVAEAIAAQASVLVTNTRYLHEAGIALAERLLALGPGGLDRVLFVNSGSEANDVAWRIARFATGRRGALVTDFAYHGVTEATTDLSPEGWPPAFVPNHVGLLPPPAAPDRDGPDVSRQAVAAVEAFARGPFPPAAMFVDPAFTSDGILGPAATWIVDTAAALRAAGGLVVGDEVQVGYGRTGEHMWGIMSSGVAPDLMTLGKPMGNGFPIAAVLGRADLVDPFIEATGYFSTFGGNTLACAAALATLDVVEKEGLVVNAASIGAQLAKLAQDVAGTHPGVGAIRSWGLLLGLEILGPNGEPDSSRASAVVNRLRTLGVLVGTTGRARNVLKVRPALVFSTNDAQFLADRLDEALRTTASTL